MHVTAPTETMMITMTTPVIVTKITTIKITTTKMMTTKMAIGDWKDDGCSNVEDDNNNYNLHEYDLNGYNNDNEDAAAKASRKLLISSVKHGST